MREIKFRYIWERPKAWAGPYRPDDDRVKIVHVSLEDIEKGKSIKPLSYPDYNYSILVARNEYTGLKDINGVEIYEGDILKDDVNDLFEVKFGELPLDKSGDCVCSYPAFYAKGYGHLGSPPYHECQEIREWMEVIGNIWENPNLVEK